MYPTLVTTVAAPMRSSVRDGKGSFYRHFSDRRELVETAIGEWEADCTEAIIAESERGDGAADKLRRLLSRVASTYQGAVQPGELMLYLEAQRRVALAITLTVGIYQLAIGAPGPMSRRSLPGEAFAATLYCALTM